MNTRTGEDNYAGFDVVLKRRGRGRWKWAVCAAGGEVVMSGSECSRDSARPQGGHRPGLAAMGGLYNLNTTPTRPRLSFSPLQVKRW